MAKKAGTTTNNMRKEGVKKTTSIGRSTRTRLRSKNQKRNGKLYRGQGK